MYINNNILTVDASLTEQGRQLLADSENQIGLLDISYFRVSDDDIDYEFYNILNLTGSEVYDEFLVSIPILQSNKNSFISFPIYSIVEGDGE